MAVCLWFDGNAEEAVKHYLSIFKDSKKGKTAYYGKNMPGKEGTVLTIEFTLNGQEFLALNGGPEFKFTHAMSIMVFCKTQKEIDEYWEKLKKGGQEIECGWLTDKFGISWQIVPEILGDMVADKDHEKSQRVMDAFMKMKKFDIKKLEEAYKG